MVSDQLGDAALTLGQTGVSRTASGGTVSAPALRSARTRDQRRKIRT